MSQTALAAKVNEIRKQIDYAETAKVSALMRSSEGYQEAIRVSLDMPWFPSFINERLRVIENALHNAYDEGPVDTRLADFRWWLATDPAGRRSTEAELDRIWWHERRGMTTLQWAVEEARLRRECVLVGQALWPAAVYRWFDIFDQLLYIGTTGDLARRTAQHDLRSSWAQFAVRSSVERYPTRGDADHIEKWAIIQEQPLFNHRYNDTPEARARLVAYLVERGRLDLLTPAISRG